MSMAYIGIGSNLGDRKYFLRNAVQELDRQNGVTVRKQAPVFETDPLGLEDQGKFLNSVVLVETTLTPEELLDACQKIEIMHGRDREVQWGPRTLDIDLLFYDDLVRKDEHLTLPHPEIEKRRFVLEPLSRITPDLKHPVLGKTVQQLLEALPEETAAECRECADMPPTIVMRRF